MLTARKRYGRPIGRNRDVFDRIRQYAAAVAPLVPNCLAVMLGDRILIELKSGRWACFSTPETRAIHSAIFDPCPPSPLTPAQIKADALARVATPGAAR